MKESYDATSRYIGIIALLTFTYLYIGNKSSLDYEIGKDSVWSRHMMRPVINYINKDKPLETEEQFQNALKKNKQRANKQLADIIAMFP